MVIAVVSMLIDFATNAPRPNPNHHNKSGTNGSIEYGSTGYGGTGYGGMQGGGVGVLTGAAAGGSAGRSAYEHAYSSGAYSSGDGGLIKGLRGAESGGMAAAYSAVVPAKTHVWPEEGLSLLTIVGASSSFIFAYQGQSMFLEIMREM